MTRNACLPQPPAAIRNRLRRSSVCLLAAILLSGCGGDKDGETSSGGGSSTTPEQTAGVDGASAAPETESAQPTGITPQVSPQPLPDDTPVVGPNLNGNWAGYYKSRTGKFENLRATITHSGTRVVISTTKSTGVARELIGRIDPIGKMLLYDSFDNEDWTTLFGPASANSINLADYVFLGSTIVDTNILILKR